MRPVLAATRSLPVAPVKRHRGVVQHPEAFLECHGEEDEGGYDQRGGDCDAAADGEIDEQRPIGHRDIPVDEEVGHLVRERE